MDFRTTSTEKSRRAGFSILEILIASGIGLTILTAVMSLTIYTSRTFAGLANYTDLERLGRSALNILTRDIRQSDRLLEHESHRIVLDYMDGKRMTFEYDPEARVLRKSFEGETKTLLEDCDWLEFTIFQRNPIPGSYDAFPTAEPESCKLIQVDWSCSRGLGQMNAVTSESVQSAKVVLRRQ